MSLSTYAQGALKRALGSQGTQPADAPAAVTANGEGESKPIPDADAESMSMNTPRVSDAENQHSGASPSQLHEIDLLLPKVCEALVLVTQCLTTIALRAEEAGGLRPTSDSRPIPQSPKAVIVAASTPSGQGLVECLVGTCPLVLGVAVVGRGSSTHASRRRTLQSAPLFVSGDSLTATPLQKLCASSTSSFPGLPMAESSSVPKLLQDSQNTNNGTDRVRTFRTGTMLLQKETHVRRHWEVHQTRNQERIQQRRSELRRQMPPQRHSHTSSATSSVSSVLWLRMTARCKTACGNAAAFQWS